MVKKLGGVYSRYCHVVNSTDLLGLLFTFSNRSDTLCGSKIPAWAIDEGDITRDGRESLSETKHWETGAL